MEDVWQGARREDGVERGEEGFHGQGRRANVSDFALLASMCVPHGSRRILVTQPAPLAGIREMLGLHALVALW